MTIAPVSQVPIVNLQVTTGRDLVEGFEWKDIAGAAIDLTGSTFKMAVKASDAAEDLLAELTTDNERFVVTDAELGLFEIHIPRTVTADWTPGVRLVHDAYRIIGDLEEPFWRGEIEVLKARAP